MSLSNAAETALLLLLFNNTDFAGIGDAGGLQNSAAAGSLYVALHTADPGETGDQTTSEAGYTSYARQAVARSGVGWTVSGDTSSNAGAVTFPTCTGSSSVCTHFSVGTEVSGAGVRLLSGALATPNSITVTTGIQPYFAAGALVVTAA